LQRRIHYGWLIVAVSFVTMSLVSPIGTTFQLFYQALKDQYHWSHASISGIYGLHQFLNGAISPLVGWLIDRYGPRRMMPLGALILGVGLVLSSQSDSLVQMYLSFGLVAALGVAMLQSVPHTAVISNWFTSHRGTAIGLALAGSGIGQLWLMPTTQWMILSFGWRAAFLLTASIIVVVPTTMILLFLYHKPANKGFKPYGEVEEQKRRVPRQVVVIDKRWAETIWTPARAVRTSRFWAMASMTFLFAFGYFLIAPQLFVLTQEYETFQAQSVVIAFIIGAQGLNKGAAKFVGGAVSDHLGREKTITLSVGLIILGLVLLSMMQVYPSAWLLFVAIFAYGMGYGCSLTAMMAAYTDLFQGPSLGTILGYLTLGGLFGGALGTASGGYLRDITGGYQMNFVIAALAFGVSTALVWSARPGSIRITRKVKNDLPEPQERMSTNESVATN